MLYIRIKSQSRTCGKELKNKDEMDKLSKRETIGPFGSSFICNWPEFTCLSWFLVLGSCILTLDSHLLSRY